MKNLHLLPTDNYSPLVHSTSRYGGLFLSKYYSPMKTMGDSYQNIYITSDEEIKEVDWCYDKVLNLIFQTDNHTDFKYVNQTDNVLKIILTTDHDLINDGVQSIDDDFLEWFVKNPSCESVEINDWMDTNGTIAFGGDRYQICNHLHDRKIIIPQEEPKQVMPQLGTEEFNDLAAYFFGGKPNRFKKINEQTEPKQETIEKRPDYYELVDKKANENNTIDLNAYAVGVEDGAKWQAERMYSKFDLDAEIAKLNTPDRYDNVKHKYNYSESDIVNLFEKWFEHHKKK